MRIVEIRITQDLASLRRRKYPEALFPRKPVIPAFIPPLRKLLPVALENTDLGVFKRRFIPTSLLPLIPKYSSGADIIGHGILIGTGILYNFAACVLDALVLEYLTPRCTVPQVNMPIAYITAINMPNDAVGCSGTTTTIPATGSLQTLVEGGEGPIYG